MEIQTHWIVTNVWAAIANISNIGKFELRYGSFYLRAIIFRNAKQMARSTSKQLFSEMPKQFIC